MTWATPPTFTDGAVLTGAQLNVLRDDLNETAPAKATTSGGLFVATGTNQIAQRVPATNFVTTVDTTASTVYVASLVSASTGPTVSVTTGTQAMVIMTCAMFNNTINGRGLMGCNVTGATTILASDDKALQLQSSTTGAVYQASIVYYETALTAGSNTFTAVYKVTSGTGTFDDRRITVFPF